MPTDAMTLTRRAGPAGPRTLDREAGTVEVVAATTAPVQRSGANPAGDWERWIEVIDIAMEPTRAAEGHLTGVSVGYRITGFRRDKATFTAAVELLELSLTPIPADASARIRTAVPGTRAPQEGRMPNDTATAPAKGATTTAPHEGDTTTRAAPTAPPAPTGAPADRGGDDTLAILKLCRKYDLHGEFAENLIAHGVTLEGARAAVLDELVRRDPFQVRTSIPRAHVGRSWDSPAGIREKLIDARAAQACAMRSLRHEPRPGRELAGMDGVAQARWYAQALGQRAGSDREALDRFVRGYHTTSDFPMIAAGTTQVVVGRAIEQAPIALWEAVSKLPASDHRARNYVSFSSASPLRDVLEAGELAYVTITSRASRCPRRCARPPASGRRMS